MIGKLTGTIDELTGGTAIVDVAGVGYLVALTTPTISGLKTGQTVSIWIKTIVRSEALELFGFLDREELRYFDLLVSISGIGPKSALAILSLAPPTTLRQAIAAGQADYLTKVAGIGRKTAQKVVMELKDKLSDEEKDHLPLTADTEAIEALQALGYSARQAREAIRGLPEEITTSEDKIKAALKQLSGK